MADYSANLYAKTPDEKNSYLEYYRNYYRNEEDKATKASGGDGAAKEDPPGETVTVNGVKYQKYREFSPLLSFRLSNFTLGRTLPNSLR